MIYKRIIGQPKMYFDDDNDVYISNIVVDYSTDAEFTGLLDNDGCPLYRFKDPIGY